MSYFVSDTALNNLLYFALGISTDDNCETILRVLVEKAYRDATNQGAFNALISPEDDEKQKAKLIAKYGMNDEEGAKDFLVNVISEYLNFENQESFDEWHKCVCKGLVDKYIVAGLEPEFQYGNAQKWVNMSLKYLTILSDIEGVKWGSEEITKILNRVESSKQYLHVPIDRFVIDELWQNKKIILPLKDENVKRDFDYKNPHEYVIGWSTWNVEQYVSTSESIKRWSKLEGFDLYEWESKKWIESSKRRKD